MDPMYENREPVRGRWYGIVNVEGERDPEALYPSKATAEREIARRRALDEGDDDHLTEYHQALPIDIAGALWNSYDPDPRQGNPLDADEIALVHRG